LPEGGGFASGKPKGERLKKKEERKALLSFRLQSKNL
jgi:hypothetical protein